MKTSPAASPTRRVRSRGLGGLQVDDHHGREGEAGRRARPADSAAEIRSPQERQRPRRSSQETIGTLSQAAICAPQSGHLRAPATKPSPRGTRCATTLRKLPTTAPKRKAKMTIAAMAAILA